MLSILWTGTVRAIAVLTAALAVAVIATSLYAARAEAGPHAATVEEMPSEPEPVEPAEPVKPVQVVQSAPAGIYAAPTDALPATRASSLSGGSAVSEPREPQPLPTRPLVAVLDVDQSEAAGAIESLAFAVKTDLEARGYEIYLAPEGAEPGTSAEGEATPGAVNVPPRPDAYVTLRGVADAAGRTRPIDVWYCELENSLSSRLARLVLDESLASFAGSYEAEDGEAESSIEEPEAFRCNVLLAGRAHMPAVLLELSAALDAPETGDGVARGVAGAIDQFFLRHGDSLLREEQRRRLVWPAVGPVTSQFGPDHPLGIDIGQSQGWIVAATDGTVTFAGGDPCCSYGLFVVIESPDGIYTLYGHFDSIAVVSGQKVRQGQPLGIIGCTGHCYGTHLHFEVIDGGVRRDPLSYLP